jgi:hypothetical protein
MSESKSSARDIVPVVVQWFSEDNTLKNKGLFDLCQVGLEKLKLHLVGSGATVGDYLIYNIENLYNLDMSISASLQNWFEPTVALEMLEFLFHGVYNIMQETTRPRFDWVLSDKVLFLYDAHSDSNILFNICLHDAGKEERLPYRIQGAQLQGGLLPSSFPLSDPSLGNTVLGFLLYSGCYFTAKITYRQIYSELSQLVPTFQIPRLNRADPNSVLTNTKAVVNKLARFAIEFNRAPWFKGSDVFQLKTYVMESRQKLTDIYTCFCVISMVHSVMNMLQVYCEMLRSSLVDDRALKNGLLNVLLCVEQKFIKARQPTFEFTVDSCLRLGKVVEAVLYHDICIRLVAHKDLHIKLLRGMEAATSTELYDRLQRLGLSNNLEADMNEFEGVVIEKPDRRCKTLFELSKKLALSLLVFYNFLQQKTLPSRVDLQDFPQELAERLFEIMVLVGRVGVEKAQVAANIALRVSTDAQTKLRDATDDILTDNTRLLRAALVTLGIAENKSSLNLDTLSAEAAGASRSKTEVVSDLQSLATDLLNAYASASEFKARLETNLKPPKPEASGVTKKKKKRRAAATPVQPPPPPPPRAAATPDQPPPPPSKPKRRVPLTTIPFPSQAPPSVAPEFDSLSVVAATHTNVPSEAAASVAPSVVAPSEAAASVAPSVVAPSEAAATHTNVPSVAPSVAASSAKISDEEADEEEKVTLATENAEQTVLSDASQTNLALGDIASGLRRAVSTGLGSLTKMFGVSASTRDQTESKQDQRATAGATEQKAEAEIFAESAALTESDALAVIPEIPDAASLEEEKGEAIHDIFVVPSVPLPKANQSKQNYLNEKKIEAERTLDLVENSKRMMMGQTFVSKNWYLPPFPLKPIRIQGVQLMRYDDKVRFVYSTTESKSRRLAREPFCRDMKLLFDQTKTGSSKIIVYPTFLYPTMFASKMACKLFKEKKTEETNNSGEFKTVFEFLKDRTNQDDYEKKCENNIFWLTTLFSKNDKKVIVKDVIDNCEMWIPNYDQATGIDCLKFAIIMNNLFCEHPNSEDEKQRLQDKWDNFYIQMSQIPYDKQKKESEQVVEYLTGYANLVHRTINVLSIDLSGNTCFGFSLSSFVYSKLPAEDELAPHFIVAVRDRNGNEKYYCLLPYFLLTSLNAPI